MSYESPLRRHRDMQKTLLIVANADSFAALKQPPIAPKPLNLAALPEELLRPAQPDPDYMDRPRNPNWRGTHD